MVFGVRAAAVQGAVVGAAVLPVLSAAALI